MLSNGSLLLLVTVIEHTGVHSTAQSAVHKVQTKDGPLTTSFIPTDMLCNAVNMLSYQQYNKG